MCIRARKTRSGHGRARPESQIGTKIRKMCAGLLCDIQRPSTDMESRTGSGQTRPRSGAPAAKPNAPIDNEELEPNGRNPTIAWRTRLADLASVCPMIPFSCNECSRATKKNTSKPDTPEAHRAVPAARTTCRVRSLNAKRRAHRSTQTHVCAPRHDAQRQEKYRPHWTTHAGHLIVNSSAQKEASRH